jgi:DNA transformation protein
MSRPVATLLNIGPTTARWLTEVGLGDEDALRAVGTEEAWRRIKARFPRSVAITAAYAIEGALLDLHWQHLPPGRREALQAELLE